MAQNKTSSKGWVTLKQLRTWEQIDTVIRKHWITYVILWVYFFLGIFFSLLFLRVVSDSPATMFILVCFWLYYVMFLYTIWLNYELDIFTITNNRVICVEQKSFLNRTVGECTLDKVQEVSFETKGLFANLLDFGTLTLKTAGSTTNFDMQFCPNPMDKARHINNVVDRYRDGQASGAGQMPTL